MYWTKGKGLVFEVVTSAKKWFSDDTARYNFYLEMIKEFEKEDRDLCRPEAKEIDPMFEKALIYLYPEL